MNIIMSRLHIRNLRLDDLDNFHAYRSNPNVTKYQGFNVMDKTEALDFIKNQTEKSFGTPGEWVQYGIVEALNNKLIGDCAIKLEIDDPKIVQIGITINPAYQNKGFAKDALLGIMAWLFDEKKIHRICETVDVENLNSIKLLESVGFRREGHFVENIFFNGKYGSEFQYAMLKKEWEK